MVYILYIYILFFYYRGEPCVTPAPRICKQTSLGFCVDLSAYFVLKPILSICDVIANWKYSLVYCIASLCYTSNHKCDLPTF